jgi:hypothetical protein
MKAMKWPIHFASYVKDMTQVWNLIIVRKFNKGIARTIISVDWCGLSKDIKFICNTFICDLIIEFYKAIEKKFSLVAIPSVESLQHCFPQS